MTTTVEVLADAFKSAGTPFMVGHPGGESVELMEAGRQRQMRFLLMKQEVAGAMLAATWGDITGSPGVCLSTRGPGAANMVTGVAHELSNPLTSILGYAQRLFLRNDVEGQSEEARQIFQEAERAGTQRLDQSCATLCRKQPSSKYQNWSGFFLCLLPLLSSLRY